MRYAPICIVMCLFLAACSSISMGDVMRECDDGKSFDKYTSCIRTTYDKHGDAKNSRSVRTFYAYVDEISRAYKNGQMSNVEALESIYKAYDKTIGSADEGSGMPICGVAGGEFICR